MNVEYGQMNLDSIEAVNMIDRAKDNLKKAFNVINELNQYWCGNAFVSFVEALNIQIQELNDIFKEFAKIFVGYCEISALYKTFDEKSDYHFDYVDYLVPVQISKIENIIRDGKFKFESENVKNSCETFKTCMETAVTCIENTKSIKYDWADSEAKAEELNNKRETSCDNVISSIDAIKNYVVFVIEIMTSKANKAEDNNMPADSNNSFEMQQKNRKK